MQAFQKMKKCMVVPMSFQKTFFIPKRLKIMVFKIFLYLSPQKFILLGINIIYFHNGFYMKNREFVSCLIVFIVLMGMSRVGCFAQTYNVPSSGNTAITACGGTIYDPGGTGSYPNSCEGYLVVYPNNAWSLVQITGSYDLESGYDYVTIYDGVGTNGTQLARGTGSGSINVTSSQGPLTIHFHSDGSVTYSGFSFSVWCLGGSCGSFGPLVELHPNSEGVLVTWMGLNDPSITGYIVEYGYTGFTPGSGTMQFVTGDSCQLTGLTALSTYDIYVYYDCNNDGIVTTEVPTVVSYCVPDGVSCMDFSDWNNPNITCTTGSFSNPYAHVGVVDNGPESINSCHTVHYQNTTDPRTGGLLNVIPPCETYSVRLGNWRTGAEAESISYDFQVDTNNADILLLKYAAVLEDPGHSSYEQPRFKFELLDQNNQMIDPTCGAADFIANPNLGWNSASGGSVLWKDWTYVGVDVSSYHGQVVRVRLTTYDCDQGGHYGYAYFTLNCKKKAIIAETCGEMMTSTYTAPSGFNYRWYYNTDPNTTIATTQTATVSIIGGAETLCCFCSYIGNPNCGFEMSTSLASRYPLALFTAERDSCTNSYTFNNESTISFDAVTPSGTGEHCQRFYWDFGDGSTSTEEYPSHEYANPGTYIVTLIATISNDECQDTISDTIVVLRNEPVIMGDFEICKDDSTALYASGGLNDYEWLQDTVSIGTGSSVVVAPADTTTYILRSYEPDGCYVDTMQEIIVHFPTVTQWEDSVCLLEGYQGHGFTIAAQENPGMVHSEMLWQDQYGCDSLVKLDLFVKQLPDISMVSKIEHCFWFDGPMELSMPDDSCESYAWSTGDLTQVITITEAGTYIVSAMKNGCSNSAQTVVEEVCIFDPILPNVMTPNGDNTNDVFIVKNMDPDVPNKLTIYNRWGKKVYEKENYQTYCWEGDPTVHNATEGFTAEGLSDGVFFYTFHYEDRVKSVDYHGTVTVIR